MKRLLGMLAGVLLAGCSSAQTAPLPMQAMPATLARAKLAQPTVFAQNSVKFDIWGYGGPVYRPLAHVTRATDYAIAAHGRFLYVGQVGRIAVFNADRHLTPTSKPLYTIASPARHYPIAFAFDPKGDAFVVWTGGAGPKAKTLVEEFAPGGRRPKRRFPSEPCNGTAFTQLAYGNEQLYVPIACAGKGISVDAYSVRTGKLVHRFPFTSALATDRYGDLFLANAQATTTIDEYRRGAKRPSKTFVSTIVENGCQGYSFSTLAVQRKVLNALFAIGTCVGVARFNIATGRQTSLILITPPNFMRPLPPSMAVGTNGLLYVTDPLSAANLQKGAIGVYSASSSNPLHVISADLNQPWRVIAR